MQSVSTSQVQGSTNPPHLPHWRTLLAFCAIICSFTNIDTDRKHNLWSGYYYRHGLLLETHFSGHATLCAFAVNGAESKYLPGLVKICGLPQKALLPSPRQRLKREKRVFAVDWDHWCKGCKGCKGSINTKEIGCDLIVLYLKKNVYIYIYIYIIYP